MPKTEDQKVQEVVKDELDSLMDSLLGGYKDDTDRKPRASEHKKFDAKHYEDLEKQFKKAKTFEDRAKIRGEQFRMLADEYIVTDSVHREVEHKLHDEPKNPALLEAKAQTEDIKKDIDKKAKKLGKNHKDVRDEAHNIKEKEGHADKISRKDVIKEFFKKIAKAFKKSEKDTPKGHKEHAVNKGSSELVR
jgi:hypothetical protein